MSDRQEPDISIRRELERTRFDTGVGTGDLADRIMVQLALDGYVIVDATADLDDWIAADEERQP